MGQRRDASGIINIHLARCRITQPARRRLCKTAACQIMCCHLTHRSIALQLGVELASRCEIALQGTNAAIVFTVVVESFGRCISANSAPCSS
ncbi:MAG: hypothetical protein AAF443_09005 [Chlamydiota bacterium]